VSGKYTSADTNLADLWREHVKPIVTQYSPKDILDLDKMVLFYYVQLKKRDRQGGKGYKHRVIVLCSIADSSKNFSH
jgi:hypothetical protein